MKEEELQECLDGMVKEAKAVDCSIYVISFDDGALAWLCNQPASVYNFTQQLFKNLKGIRSSKLARRP